MVKQILFAVDIQKKLIRYCGFQERCRQEVKEKLGRFNLNSQEKDIILKYLIDHDIVNEERFAERFTLSRVRYKKWGRKKIAHELRLKSISEALIERAWKAVDQEEYKKMLSLFIESKLGKMPGKFTLRKCERVSRFLSSKGYEDDLIRKAIQEHLVQTN